MGMFDDIKCEYPLPDDPPGIWFQTKSLDRQLEPYAIRRDGTLWKLREYYEDVLPWDYEPTRLRFTGIVNFYGSFDEDWLPEAERDTTWHEYDARLRRGRLVALTVVGSERQEEWRAFMDELMDRILDTSPQSGQVSHPPEYETARA